MLAIAKRQVVPLMLLIGLLQVAAYYVAGATIRSDGGFPIGQPDTLLYCQAARRIVEGHPFSFSEGSLASTGTTSVLYPFALAVLGFFGANGDTLILAGFLLNAAFYLLFLLGWGVVIRAKCAEGVPMLLCSLLVALSGQSAFCAMSASDTGFWMAASSLIAAGLVIDKILLYMPMLVLSPWIRPEGAIMAVAFALTSSIAVFLRQERARKVFLTSLMAIVSFGGVLCLNYLISGRCGFSSVANKGHLVHSPFTTGVILTFADFVRMIKAYLLGIPASLITRNFQLMPVLGAAFLWLGVFTRDWKQKKWWNESGWLLAGMFGFFVVAIGGGEGENMDRYLAWFLPTVALFVSEGVSWFSCKIGSLVSCVAPTLVLVVYAMLSAVANVMLFHDASEYSDTFRSFAAKCEDSLPEKASVGVFGCCGAAYQMSPRPVKNLSGIYSLEFGVGMPSKVIEILKHEKTNRFDYWLLNTENEARNIFSSGKIDLDLLGEAVLTGPQSHELRKADWTIFDSATAIPQPVGEGRKLVSRVDVCYDIEEKKALYEPLTIYNQPIPKPFTHVASNDSGIVVVDSGRLLLGGDEMSVALMPGHDVEVVMRTLSKVYAAAYGVLGVSAGGNCSFKSPMELFVVVDGEPVGKVSFEVREDGFTDAHFNIPASAIRQSPCRIGFHGEHVACCYWFYQ